MNIDNKHTEPSFYAIIPANVRYNKNLCANAKLLYGEITALCNQKGYCWAENNYFAELYNVSKSSISKWISSLVENNFISTEIIYKENTKATDIDTIKKEIDKGTCNLTDKEWENMANIILKENE